jgi:DNA-binding Lrp family transcriptional regulator
MPDIDIGELDAVDRDILRNLQADGRLTNAELAKRVRLSPSPCLRRVKSLEDRGYIRGYTALLDRGKVRRAGTWRTSSSVTSSPASPTTW